MLLVVLLCLVGLAGLHSSASRVGKLRVVNCSRFDEGVSTEPHSPVAPPVMEFGHQLGEMRCSELDKQQFSHL